MTDVVLIRHARHVLGADTIVGRTPAVPLSDQGRAQAESLVHRLEGVVLRAVYCGPLERATQTAAPLARRYGLAAEICPAVDEVDYGEWSGRTLEDLSSEPSWKLWNIARGTARVPGGESMLEVQARVVHQLAAWAAHHQHQSIAVVSHGDVIKAALAHCLGTPLDLLLRIEIAPSSISVVRIEQHHLSVLCVNHAEAVSHLGLV